MRNFPISSDLFVAHRRHLMEILPHGAVAVLHANDRMPTNADGTMPYCQNSDLFYLTGITQEDSTLLICPDFPHPDQREVLFVTAPDVMKEKWEGKRLTKKEIASISGISTVMWSNHFEDFFMRIMAWKNLDHVFLNTNEHIRRAHVSIQTKDMRFITWCRSRYPLHRYDRLAPFLATLRSVKHPLEIDLLQEACNITAKGFARVFRFVKPGVMEYEVEAEYIHEFIRRGSSGFAYEPIIASGTNNCILHYTSNDQKCKKGDLLLLDVGASYAYYHADVTRTIPISGKFTKRQKEVYNAVLRVMRGAMQLLRVGIYFADYQKNVNQMMEEELLMLKLISQEDIKKQQVAYEAVGHYFYHGVSHMLGLDVHDVGDMQKFIPKKSVWTIEPGIYLAKEGFGIRLENNVVVEEDNVKDLTAHIPIEIEEIESIMQA